MKLEQNDKPLLFSETSISDIFFREYLSIANGDFVKVYLYLLYLAKTNSQADFSNMSKQLNLALPVINSAITFWTEKKLITKTPDGFLLSNLQEIELNKQYKPNLTLSPDKVDEIAKNQYREKAIQSINNTCFKGSMTSTWYSEIDLLFSKYQFEEQVMVMLFEHCKKNSSSSFLNKNYVEAVAAAWNNSGIKTYSDLESYFTLHEKSKKINTAISKKLGLHRSLTEYEEAFIQKWTGEFNYSMDIINIALKKTTSKANPNFDYLDKLLSDWYDRGLKTVEAIESFLASMKQKGKNVKELEKKTNYNNYKQRQYENLNDLYANNSNKKGAV
jgi:DnaD/phage-associated family protein